MTKNERKLNPIATRINQRILLVGTVPDIQVAVASLKKLVSYTNWYRSGGGCKFHVLTHSRHPTSKIKISLNYSVFALMELNSPI